MSNQNYTLCDNKGCKNKVDNSKWDAETYHQLSVGGSDFEMSFGGNREFDFCSFECLMAFLEEATND